MGLIHDVIAVLPLDDLKVLLDVKMETRVYIRTLVKIIRIPILEVSISFFLLLF
jgi:hypothetical protein